MPFSPGFLWFSRRGNESPDHIGGKYLGYPNPLMVDKAEVASCSQVGY